MTKNEALRMALDALQRIDLWLKARYEIGLVGVELDAIKACEEALAHLEPEPVAKVAEIHLSRYTIEWVNGPLPEGTPLYTHSKE